MAVLSASVITTPGAIAYPPLLPRSTYVMIDDWLTGDVLHVSADGKPAPLLKLKPGSADHTYLADRQLLVIPLMKDNLLRAYRWTP